MNFTSLVMKGLASRARSFERATMDPVRIQERILLKYLARNRRTDYGMKFDLSSIRSIDEFRDRLPISDYETMRPYVDRMEKGERNVLTHDKVTFFGITSGTTGAPKMIPVTKYSQGRKADLMNLWAYYAAKDHPRVFDGDILGIISPEVKSHTVSGIPYGPEDGHAYNNLPEAVKRLYVLPYQVFYIDDYDARYYCILRISIEKKIATIATLNPSSLVLLCQRLGPWQGRIIADIERGTLDRSFNIPAQTRMLIEKSLRPNPGRAHELRKMLEEHGELLPKYFWPGLELIACWKGGTVKFYLGQLPRYYGDAAIRDFGCLSTEARSSVPISDLGAGGVLAIQHNFYEFIPSDEMVDEGSRTLLCDELEVGKEYIIIVTTPAGLHRYNIDDVIRVDGFYNNTPVIEFVRKGHNAISITGEKIYESHVVEAVTRASARRRMSVSSFCATVAIEGLPRYVFLAEFESKPAREDARGLLMAIEEELRGQNSEYDDLRKQQLLANPSLKIVACGEFERYRREAVAAGSHDTQFKMPRIALSADFQKRFNILEEIFIDR